jgi:transcriptional regulator with XRE-family HTH domain
MKLKSYLSEIGMTQRDFCDILQCNYAYFSMVMNGRRIPSRRFARDIEDLTDGNVKVPYVEKKAA